ncbi:hypothetical protein XELAEV_18011768mg [Xenopus laevis]|nr:hypothetical protein XELAEV_18011768mg [Xenopus laevis]
MAWMLLVLCNLFILCTLQYIRAITAEEISPLHVKIKNVTVKPASLSITWYCNITEKMKNYTYNMIIKDYKQKFPLNIQNCSTEFFIHQHKRLTLHQGVSIKITANGTETEHDTWTTFYPEGEKQTSAKNVSCFVHVSAVNCSWNFSEKAPNDTIYSLWL